MNQRIQELAQQAGMGQERWNTTVQFESFLEKFAQLIVGQCADLTRWTEHDMSAEQRIRFSIYQEIKENFGVKP